MLDAKATLSIPEPVVTVRHFSESEAVRLQELIRNRNAYSRHSYESPFYVVRAGELSDKTVVEVTLPGDPKGMVGAARRIASIVESVAVVSTVLYHPRGRLHTDLGITQHRKDVVDLTLGATLQYLSAGSRREVPARGLTIDKRFVDRFNRLDLGRVVSAAIDGSRGGQRIEQSVRWLLESRLETEIAAAAIKCAIALETLLGRSETEPLRATLSERSAFLLSEDPDMRVQVSKLVKSFYDGRSAIVHGASRKKARGVSGALLEAAERIAFLVMITLGANHEGVAGDQALPEWVEGRRWGAPRTDLTRPFRPGDLKRALMKNAKA